MDLQLEEGNSGWKEQYILLRLLVFSPMFCLMGNGERYSQCWGSSEGSVLCGIRMVLAICPLKNSDLERKNERENSDLGFQYYHPSRWSLPCVSSLVTLLSSFSLKRNVFTLVVYINPDYKSRDR